MSHIRYSFGCGHFVIVSGGDGDNATCGNVDDCADNNNVDGDEN